MTQNIRRSASKGLSAAVDFIVTNIEGGTWKPGSQLPTERELEEKFGVARNTLRKGLRVLVDEGRITRHVGRGTFVAADKPSIALSAGGGAIERRIQRASPAEIMDVRLIIEPQAIEAASGRATEDDIQFLMECVAQSEASDSVAQFERWDGALHERIVAAANNRLLSMIYETINHVRNTVTWGMLKERGLTIERRNLYKLQHRRIVGALHERDAERARQALFEHLIAVRDSLLGANIHRS